MLTDNYKKWKAFAMGAAELSSTPQALAGEITATNLNGVTTAGYTHIVLSEQTAARVLSDAQASYVYYGSSSEPPCAGDSALKSPYSTILKVVSTVTVSSEYKDHSCLLKISSSAKNVSSQSLAIGELVWLKQLPLTKGASASTENVLVCMARCVLETPVTVEAGQTKVFEIALAC